MYYYQTGGSLQGQQVAREQAQQQQEQLNELFMQIAKDPQVLQQLKQQGIDPNQVVQLIKQQASSNPAAKQALAALTQMARQGAKLTYIRRLRGGCPPGYETEMFKAGGRVCTRCKRKAEAKERGGNLGDESQVVKDFKSLRCGGKTKKK